jgi:hypothetical protein
MRICADREGRDMSNALAIAASTSALRNLLLQQVPVLDSSLADVEVTTRAPDTARKNVTKAQLNLFLYQVTANAAWRNMDLPRQVRPGETGFPPLALNLRYMLTAYGREENDSDATCHRVLGAAMSTLHDHALLSADEIRNSLPGNDLADQIERVRVTPLQIPVEELSKLWTAFQTNYRVSTAYEVALVLIDSRMPTRAPVPVLKRGPTNRGVATMATAAPVLETLELPNRQSAVRLGEDIVLTGKQLSTEGVTARFSSARLDTPIDVALIAGDAAGTLKLHLKNDAEDTDALSRWAPGVYMLALRVKLPDVPALVSNELPVALAPVITLTPLNAPAGNLALTITCAPRIREGQRVLLLFGDRVVTADALSNPADKKKPTSLAFTVPEVEAGTYTVRLRVDGADSIPVDFSSATPEFDSSQQVKVA